MTKDKALMIRERINDGIEQRYKSTAVIADIEEMFKKDFCVHVRPDRFNEGDCFHQIELIADIARGFDVNAFAVIVDGTIHVKIF